MTNVDPVTERAALVSLQITMGLDDTRMTDKQKALLLQSIRNDCEFRLAQMVAQGVTLP